MDFPNDGRVRALSILERALNLHLYSNAGKHWAAAAAAAAAEAV
jgi:hypothetical protein